MKVKYLFFLPLLSLFILASCKSNNTDKYKDKIIAESNKVTYAGEITTTYNTGDSISIGNLTVKYNGTTDITYLDSNNDDIPSDKFFITTSKESPTVSRLKPSDKLNTSKQSYTTNVYVAFINSEDDHVYISAAKQITIKNSNALNPILYYVGGGVIIVAVAALVFFTKRYKENHPR